MTGFLTHMLTWRVFFVFLIGVMFAGLTGCNITGTNNYNFGSSIGQREHPRVIAAYGGVYRNKKIEELLDELTISLVAASNAPQQNYRVTVLNSPVVNAFALPGGYIYVTRGLLALANDNSEVAAVLAHEMAHVTENHAFARQKVARQVKLASKVRPVKDVIADGEQGQIALASGQVSLASFSRSQEIAADRIGVDTMARAGFDAFAAVRFLTNMGRYARFRTANLTRGADNSNFLASHPATPERIAKALEAARNVESTASSSSDRARYLAVIDGMTFGDDPSEGYVRRRSYLHPRLGFSFELPQDYILENTAQAVLAAHRNGTAIRFDGVQLSRQKSLADYLNSGWVNGLLASTIQTRTINGFEMATADATAKGWQFHIGVVRLKGGVYRFIFANANPSVDLRKDAEATLKSFRRLERNETLRLKPLSLKVVKVRSRDSVVSFARQMQGVDRAQSLFLILNGLEQGARLEPGTFVKIIAE